jgi:hypothetical protein
VTTSQDVQEAARAIGLQVRVLNAITSCEIDAVFVTVEGERLDALFVAGGPFLGSPGVQIVSSVARDRIPAVYGLREYVVAGGLMSCGTNFADQFHQVGVYTGSILKGANPAELPVLQPAKFELVIPATGERIPVRRWASETFAQPGRRGRQHWVQHITFEGTADGVTVRSYWKVLQGLASANTRTLNAMGYYEDFCVKFDGRWLIKEKRIYRCNDETPLPW